MSGGRQVPFWRPRSTEEGWLRLPVGESPAGVHHWDALTLALFASNESTALHSELTRTHDQAHTLGEPGDESGHSPYRLGSMLTRPTNGFPVPPHILRGARIACSDPRRHPRGARVQAGDVHFFVAYTIETVCSLLTCRACFEARVSRSPLSTIVLFYASLSGRLVYSKPQNAARARFCGHSQRA
jgi:hypothetical protein